MNSSQLTSPKAHRVPCTVRINHSFDHLEAHVELDGYQPDVGDRITVLGAPVITKFGESMTLEREALVRPATTLQKLLVRLKSFFLLTELYEVSFTPRRF
ncbi:MAG: hypothetical protein AAFR21_05500 [Pseudomonadota bacterium]